MGEGDWGGLEGLSGLGDRVATKFTCSRTRVVT